MDLRPRTRLWHLVDCEWSMWKAFNAVKTLYDIDEWDEMSDEELLSKVMKAAGGKASPKRVMEIIKNGG